MKKIINGKLFNTETAKCIGCYQYSYPGDFHYCREALYRKRSGEYFLHGEGGPNSIYQKDLGSNQWSGGESISPMSADEAKEWAEENLDADDYIAEFGEPEE